MGFIVIWDTCTKPDYYNDVHKVITLPKRMVVRYDYTKKYFDEKSLIQFESLSARKIKEIPAIHFYGEIENYSKFQENIPDKAMVKHWVPFRLSTVVCAKNQRSGKAGKADKVVYDILLGDYPNLKNLYRHEETFNNEFKERAPFSKWHTYIESDEILIELSNLGGESSDSNWFAIVERLQELQFENDSFWKLEGPYDDKGTSKANQITLKKTTDGLKESVILLKDEEDVIFTIHNADPVVQESKVYPQREIILTSSEGITTNRRKIQLRPYSTYQFKIRGKTSSYWKGDFGNLECVTRISDKSKIGIDTDSNSSLNTDIIGPSFDVNFNINKNLWKVFVGICSGVISVVLFIILSKYKIYDKPAGSAVDILNWSLVWIAASIGGVASLLLVIATILLRKEIKFNLN